MATYETRRLLGELDTVIDRYDAAVARAAEAWVTNEQHKWRGLRDMITQHLRRGKPITTADIAAATGGQRDTWSMTFAPSTNLGRYYSGRGRKAYTITTADLRSLRQALRATHDATITDRTLATMGYPGSVAIIFNAAQGLTEGYQ